MKEVRFNIENFQIEDREDGYKNYLVFLIRYFFNSKDFSGSVSKKDFIDEGIKRGFNERNLENIYQKGKVNNPFIRKIKKKDRRQIIILKSLFNKEKSSNYLVYIEDYILEKITDIKIFRSFCYIVIASKPLKSENIVSKKKYFNKNPSRVLNTIGKSFGNTEKTTMSKRLNKALELFSDIFNITSRYSYYNGFMVQLSNLYSIEGVRYIVKKDSKKQKIVEYKDFSKFNIKNRFIKGKKKIFGEKAKEYRGFLHEDFYSHLYLKIKEEVFK